MHEHLTVGYHQQDTNYYCGAACAQMVLHTVGQPLLSQDDLYNDNHSHSVEPGSWATPPDGLRWTMNNRQSQKYFVLDSLGNEDAASRMLCWTIHHYQVAPIALVEGGNHWVVVRGYTASAAPSSSQDTSYTITSFDLNNPWPPTPPAQAGTVPPEPPPHSDGDVCGSGGARGVADTNVSYSTWQSDYMTANGFGTQWYGRYVAVCDPDRPPKFGQRPLPERKRLFDGESLVEAGIIRERFLESVRLGGLAAHPEWSEVFRGVRSGDPLLVQRLDRPDSYYWIVPAEDGEGGLKACVAIDARFGDYQQAISVVDPGARLFAYAREEEVTEHVMGGIHALAADAGRLVVRREGMCVHPALVWRPCRESLSPFYPFRMVTVGAHRLFVRVFDGAVFTSLTADRGGI